VSSSWPPQDPTAYRPHSDYLLQSHHDNSDSEGEGRALHLPASPWTYANGSINPNLQPSNAYRRASKKTKRGRKTDRSCVPIASVPPYHPDYVDPSSDSGVPPPAPGDESSSASEGEEEADSDDYDLDVSGASGHRVRRGSEGYEVKPADREEILRRYILSRGEEVGHYKRYVPERATPPSESDTAASGGDPGNGVALRPDARE